MSPPSVRGPRGSHVTLDQIFEYISSQFDRLEGKLDSIAKDFVMRRELELVQKDVDRAHSKARELEDRLRAIEVTDAGDRAENKSRFTAAEKAWGIVLGILTVAAMTGLGLRG